MSIRIFSLWLVMAVFASPLYAASSKSLTILYTADVHGEDRPTFLCAGKTGGGLARKAIMVGAWRTITPDMLLLDCGGVLPLDNEHPKLRSDIIFKGMNELSYDAMNLSGSDFILGESYLESWSASLSFPLISSNLVSTDGTPPPPWIKRFAILRSGALSIGVLGVMPEDAFDRISDARTPSGMQLVSSSGETMDREPTFQKPSGLKIIPPLKAVADLLPELAGQVDYIVLLSQLSVEDTAALVSRTEGIDLALSHERRHEYDIEKEGEISVAPCGTRASNLEIMELSISPEGKTTIVKSEPIEMGDIVPHDPDMEQLIADAYAEKMREIREERKSKKMGTLHRQLMEGLTMSPEDFLLKMNQEGDAGPAVTGETGGDVEKPSSN